MAFLFTKPVMEALRQKYSELTLAAWKAGIYRLNGATTGRIRFLGQNEGGIEHVQPVYYRRARLPDLEDATMGAYAALPLIVTHTVWGVDLAQGADKTVRMIMIKNRAGAVQEQLLEDARKLTH